METNKIYLNNTLTIGIVDHGGKNYLTKCIHEGTVAEKRTASFRYFIVCYDNEHNVVEYRLPIVENKDNESTYNLKYCSPDISYISIYIETDKITKDTDYMIYLIEDGSIFTAHNIINYYKDERDFISLTNIIRDGDKWYTFTSVKSENTDETC